MDASLVSEGNRGYMSDYRGPRKTAHRRYGGTFLIPRNTHLPEDCRPVGEVLARVGDKWSVLVVMLLGGGAMRFNEIRIHVGGISQRMLTMTLRGLEPDG